MFLIGPGLFRIMFFLVFGLVFVTIIVTLVQNLFRWNKNNQSPRLTVPVTAVSKRIEGNPYRTGELHTGRGDMLYYVTFQVESGDRMELQLSGSQYGLIVEGDRGTLTFQGTRFLNFERQF